MTSDQAAHMLDLLQNILWAAEWLLFFLALGFSYYLFRGRK